MSSLWEGRERLSILSRYNRTIGLPSLLITSLTTSLSVGISLLFGVDGSTPLLTLVTQATLLFMVVDAALILSNLLIMSSYLVRVLSGFRRKGLPYDSLSGVEAYYDMSGLILKMITTISIFIGVFVSSFNFLKIFVKL